MMYFDIINPEYDQMIMYASMRNKDGRQYSLKKTLKKMQPIDVTSTEIITDQNRLIGGN